MLILMPTAFPASLRFFGNGDNDIDRVKVRIDNPNVSSGETWPADVGAQDFTIEFWMRATAANNQAGSVSCGANVNWINGNIVVDRDRYNQDRKFGLSIAGGRLVFGISGNGTGDRTICSSTNVLDNQWHHVAIQRRRSDGFMYLYVDGSLEASFNGPDGDISYPDNGVPMNFCGGPCTNSDPFLVFAAEKHDAGGAYPAYNGFLDEIRISNVLRYTGSSPGAPSAPFVTDANTLALYHLDEGSGTTAGDTSGHPNGPSNGVIRVGGSPTGPQWSTETPFTGAPLQTAYVNFNYTGTENGSQSNPFNTLAEGLAAVVSDGTVRIAPGDTNETPTINQNVTLEATGVSAQIGVSGARSLGAARTGFVAPRE